MVINLLLIDNHDSFTYNLAHLLIQAGAYVRVENIDNPDLNHIARHHAGLVFSPGPSHPDNATRAKQLFMEFLGQKPMFGVCLGMQIFNAALGGGTGRAPYPMHGKTARITKDTDSQLLHGIPETFEVARYHSLICNPASSQFKVTAHLNALIMALEHKTQPVYGVQFHPESFMSAYGLQIAKNFIGMCAS